MGVMCAMLGHEAGDMGLWNDGYYFSRCERCECDLIRTSGDWAPIPFGYQVAWKSGVHRHAIGSDFKRNLPLLPDEPRRWKLAVHRIARTVLLLPGPVHAEAQAVRTAHREASAGLPQVVLLGMLTALGLATRMAVRRR